MKQYCLACDLKETDTAIKAYEEYHKNVWPEIKESLERAGVLDMEIYRAGNRLFMIMQVSDEFSFESKAAMDMANPVVQEWEELMSGFQQRLPWAPEEVKWTLMDRLFKLDEKR